MLDEAAWLSDYAALFLGRFIFGPLYFWAALVLENAHDQNPVC